MTLNLRDLLRRLSEHGEPAGAETVLDRAEMVLHGEQVSSLVAARGRRAPTILIVSGASLATLVLFGGLTLALRSGWGAESSEVPWQIRPSLTTITQPSTPGTGTTTTTEPQATTTSSAATTTIEGPPATSPPTTAAAFTGEILEYGDGWLEVAAEITGPAAARREAGVAAFGTNESAWISAGGETWETAEFTPSNVDSEYGLIIDHLAAGPAGFVAAAGSDGGAQVFFSKDGTSWEAVTPFTPAIEVMDVAAGPPGFIVFGRTADCLVRVAFSPDGREWTTGSGLDGCVLTGSIWAGTNWIALGAANDGALSEYISDDGLEWIRIEMDRAPGNIGGWGLHLAGWDGHLVLLGTEPGTLPAALAVCYSTDAGRTWSDGTIVAPPDAPEGEYQVMELIHSDFGYFAVGPIETRTDSVSGFVLYSPDGAAWSLFELEGHWFRDIAAIDGGLLGFGNQGVLAWEPGE